MACPVPSPLRRRPLHNYLCVEGNPIPALRLRSGQALPQQTGEGVKGVHCRSEAGVWHWPLSRERRDEMWECPRKPAGRGHFIAEKGMRDLQGRQFAAISGRQGSALDP